MPTIITVKNVARRPVDLPGGRVLAHGERGSAEDGDVLRALINSGLLVDATPTTPPALSRRGGDA